MSAETLSFLTERLGAFRPSWGIVLGSGLGGFVDAVKVTASIPFSDIPGFPVSHVSGHSGQLVAGHIGSVPVAILSGRVHYYETGDAAAMRLPLTVLQGLGIDKLVLTNSAGSLRDDMPPGSVMLIADHINFSGANPLIGESSDRRFVGLTNAYDGELAERLDAKAKERGIPLAKGVYMWFSGPSFETPAEIRMARLLGADAVGMSTVPEVIIARMLGLRVAAASVITNYAAGMTGGELSHDETKAMAPVGGTRLATLLQDLIAG